MQRLLLVEDDETLGSTLTERLSREGYVVTWTKSKSEAQAAFGNLISSGPAVSAAAASIGSTKSAGAPFDLAILDVGLPDGSGLDLARDIRFATPLPIIFLSAMTSPEFRLEGFEIGAEDYVPKPFHLRELLLRVQRVMGQGQIRRSAEQVSVSSPDFGIVDREALCVVSPDGTREFPNPRDFQLLCLLVDVSPRVVGRDEILEKLWPQEPQQTGRTVDNAVVRLRQVLRVAPKVSIRTVRGVGYQFLSTP